MLILTVTAHYPQDADVTFADSLSFDQFVLNMSGLFEYRGLPSGDLFEGQTYRFTPVLWTLFHFPQTDVTYTRVDHKARICANVSTQPSGANNPYETRIVTQITPTPTGCLWTDRIEMTGPRPGLFSRAITRYLQNATHRRRGAHDITVDVHGH